MTRKPTRHLGHVDVAYSKKHWQLLRRLRCEAVELMKILDVSNLPAVTHGSIARGDVTVKSDIDVFVLNSPSSFAIETALDRAGVQISKRVIIQATPHHVLKGYIEIDDRKTISFPLAKMTQIERGFYRFGGEIHLKGLRDDLRVVGVDKRLMLIVPTEKGHVESNIVGREEEVARLLEISAETVFDRVRALLRRDKLGRTGVFIERMLHYEETFGMALKRLAETKPEVRRRLRYYR